LQENVAPHYGKLRYTLEQNGTPMSANDLLIAAHAITLDATLITADAAFQRIPQLTVHNWYQ
jgi:tRNA(fMet)-specific endonuclease VapC